MSDKLKCEHGYTEPDSNCPECPYPKAQSELSATHCSAFAFVMDRMPWEKEWMVRIVFPGMDGDGAIWFEATFERETRQEAEDMLDKILAGLPNVKREKPNKHLAKQRI
jgi:hypothetical protein